MIGARPTGRCPRLTLGGQLSAVNIFNAVSKFLACAARFLSAHAGGNYSDVHFSLQPTYMSKSGQDELVLLASTLGFLFDPEKHVSMRPEFVYLGFSHDLSSAGSGTVRVRIFYVCAQ